MCFRISYVIWLETQNCSSLNGPNPALHYVPIPAMDHRSEQQTTHRFQCRRIVYYVTPLSLGHINLMHLQSIIVTAPETTAVVQQHPQQRDLEQGLTAHLQKTLACSDVTLASSQPKEILQLGLKIKSTFIYSEKNEGLTVLQPVYQLLWVCKLIIPTKFDIKCKTWILSPWL